ncbi:uncharacterized protein LOC126611874 [Malus sylvestris]|nr:uncharacterized protein LOC126611874 [Malus sylvestris]
MANLAEPDFVSLDITGKNYLTWVVDAKIHLEAGNLGDTIKEGSNTSSQDQVKAMIFIRCQLDEGLKREYLMVEDPLAIWKALRNRYNHQKTDFKMVGEYNSAIFRIRSQMKLCGETIVKEDMMEKTFSTFHASNVLFQQQYGE